MRRVASDSPQVKASYLASPPLCVAYALKGTVLCDLTVDPLGMDRDGKPVYLKDLWPTAEESEQRAHAENEAALARIAELERKLRGET